MGMLTQFITSTQFYLFGRSRFSCDLRIRFCGLLSCLEQGSHLGVANFAAVE